MARFSAEPAGAQALMQPLLDTFRDPAGSVALADDGVYRTVYPPAAADILAFLSLDLAADLVRDGILIPTQITESAVGGLLLRHERVPFISYPWEWPAAMWHAAGRLTLQLCEDLLAAGWILKDATPLNVLFHRGRPIFVDILSIQPLDAKKPLWFAYAQFMRTFVLPLLAHARLGWDLAASQVRRDGYLPSELLPSLSLTERFRPATFGSVTLPALFSARIGKAPVMPEMPFQGDEEQCRFIIGRALQGLRKRLQKLSTSTRGSAWSAYTTQSPHYSAEDHGSKIEFVRERLTAIAPRRVLDVGCNIGVYSRLAADAGAAVVAIDTDEVSLSLLYAHNAGARNILPLAVNLARPTPPTGWENAETLSFLDRAAGHFDTVLLLAVVHHLLLQDQIPMDKIASLCSRLTSAHLIVEWVPPEDPMFRALVRGRDTLYAGIQERAFRVAFAHFFDTAAEQALDNGRILLHLCRRGG